MLPSKKDFLDHVKWLRRAVLAVNAELILAGDSLHALIRQGSRHWALHPQFVTRIGGTAQYTTQLLDDTESFAGWRPYRSKRWPISTDKLAFKRFAIDADLPVPEHHVQATDALRDVVVKRAASSFGRHLHGPFRSARERTLDLSEAEYYERFVEGDILKIWFWNELPVCAEQDRMPFVIGDGVSSIRELIVRRAEARRQIGDRDLQEILAYCAGVLRYFGTELAAVLPKGAAQTVEFRYASFLRHPRTRITHDLTTMLETPWAPIVRKAGSVLHAGIPANVRANSLFTVDAILDAGGKVWFLEMNSNPITHPLAYPHIVRSVLSTPVSASSMPSQQPPGPSPVPAVR